MAERPDEPTGFESIADENTCCQGKPLTRGGCLKREECV
jgi:hypothetical protein